MALRTLLICCGMLLGALAASRPAYCAEDSLYRADFTIEINLADSFFDRLEAQGEELDEELYSLLLDPVRGGLHFATKRRRIDMPYGPAHHAASIVDRRLGTLLLLDYAQETAWRCSLEDVSAELAAEGLPLISAEQFFLCWDEIELLLSASPQVKRSELGTKEIAGLNCRGLRYSAPFAAVSQADGIELIAELPVLRKLDGNWEGVFWISEQHGLPVKMQMDFCGMSIVWQLSAIAPASGMDVLFSVPRLYKTAEISAAEVF